MELDVVIMNFSGVYSLMKMPPGRVVDCTDIVGCDCYCDAMAAETIAGRIESSVLCSSKGISASAPSGIHFIDSGDYHYVTKFWTDRIKEPFNIVLFDHHPDMQEPEFPDFLSCGGWMREVQEKNEYSIRALIIGSDPKLSKEALEAADRVWLIDQRHLFKEAFEDALPFFDDNLPVYLSIDKDVLDTEWARADWDQGVMTLQTLESWLGLIFQRFRVIGVDICGEKPLSKGGMEEDWELNSNTNLELASFLDEMIGR